MRSRDPIGDYLGRRMATFREPVPHSARPVRPYSISRILVMALVPVAITGAIVALTNQLSHQADSQPPGQTPRIATDHTQDLDPVQVGRVVLVTVDVRLTRATRHSTPEAGQALFTSDELTTGHRAYAGLQIAGVHSMVIGPDSNLTLERGEDGQVHVRLHRGNLAVRTYKEPRLLITGNNARVQSRHALFVVEGNDGDIQRVVVDQGELDLQRTSDGRPFGLARGDAIDTLHWTVAPGLPVRDILDKLQAVAALTAPPEQHPSSPVPSSAPSTSGQPSGLAAKIRKAIDDGDVSQAMELVKSQGAGQNDTDYWLAAADTFKAASQWAEAADQYEAASDSSSGEEAERALLRAAQIHLKKLSDPTRAAQLLDEYLERFPTGTYLDEALYLAAIVHVRLGNPDEARTHYENYLHLYPDGVQAVRARIALAKLLAFSLDDCPAAMSHVDALQQHAQGTAIAKQLAQVQKACAPQEAGP